MPDDQTNQKLFISHKQYVKCNGYLAPPAKIAIFAEFSQSENAHSS